MELSRTVTFWDWKDRGGVFDAWIVHCDERTQLSSTLDGKWVEEKLSCIMANERSHFLALVQPITTEVLLYRRFVQQPVQRAPTVVFFLKMHRKLSQLSCMRNVLERCWVCHLDRVETWAHGVTNDCLLSPICTKIWICTFF